MLRRERGIATDGKSSVCDDKVSCSHRLEFIENNFTVIMHYLQTADPNSTDLQQSKGNTPKF